MRSRNHCNTARAFPPVSKFLHDLANSSASDVADREFVASRPSANVIEFDMHYELQIAVPGVSKKDIVIEVKEGILKILATRNEANEDNVKYRRCEFNYSSFNRSFKLGKHVKVDGIEAIMENGVLTITLPKSDQEADKKEISIK
jgi:HSP20 family protein